MSKRTVGIIIGVVAVAVGVGLIVTAGDNAPDSAGTDADQNITAEEAAVEQTAQEDEASAVEEDGETEMVEIEQEASVSSEGGNDDGDTPGSTDEQPDDVEASGGEAVVINLTGENYEFSQEEIRVQKGQEVTVNFTSEGGFHDFVVGELGVSTDGVSTGESASVTFVADEVGSFDFYCSIGNHREMGMEGTLIVEE